MLRFALLFAAVLPLTFPARAQEPAAPAVTAAPEAEAPMPDIRALMLDVEHNQRRFEEARRDYTFHVHTVEEDFDSRNKVKKTTVTDAESFSINGVRVNKIVAKNGKPLTEEEQKKESERIDKAVARAKERRAKNESRNRETDSQGNEVITVSRILELGSFTHPRRVDLNGRPTILLDYAGDPSAKTHSTFENVFKDLVGQVWIDERDHVLTRGEGRFAKDFKMGGGLLFDIHSGFNFHFQSKKINQEVWLPEEIEAQGSASALLFVRVRGHVDVTTSDYRKFRTSTTIIPTGNVIGPDGQPVPADPAEPPPPPPPNQPHPLS